MKKKRIVIIVMLVVFVAAGIAAAVLAGGTRREKLADTTFYNQSMGLAIATDDGLYHVDSRNFLYFYDYKEKEDVQVCNKPNCTHETWQEDTPDEERCHSYLGEGLIGGFLSADQLYTIQIDPMLQQAVITSSAMDRSAQKKVAELTMDHLDTFAVKDGILYLAGISNELETDENGMQVPTGVVDTWIYSVDLDTGKQKELTPKQKGNNATLQVAGLNEDKLYCRGIFFEKPFDGLNFEEAGQRVTWYVYDIAAGTYEKTLEGADGNGGFYMAHNTLLYDVGENWGDNGFERYAVYAADLASGEIKKCGESDQQPQYADGKAFLTEGETYRYYEAETKKTRELQDSVLNAFYCWQTPGEYIHGVTAGQNGQPCLITKKDFYNGNEVFIPLKWENGEAE
ncbi:hypothetical protein [Ruminococcus gauvreauii]|uniref:DUF5050 domain-containing protein n=1 Tax=Ruminococcus gauvreauii TaxID=438033 RepID=A0ABY5VEJ1_9FIRM|nr:hypothetical protein [Ruminococcus gauvreauii]UWP58666.1 hypothetical protein NQ502_14975 [Ruminococcus gauvreauii]